MVIITDYIMLDNLVKSNGKSEIVPSSFYPILMSPDARAVRSVADADS